MNNRKLQTHQQRQVWHIDVVKVTGLNAKPKIRTKSAARWKKKQKHEKGQKNANKHYRIVWTCFTFSDATLQANYSYCCEMSVRVYDARMRIGESIPKGNIFLFLFSFFLFLPYCWRSMALTILRLGSKHSHTIAIAGPTMKTKEKKPQLIVRCNIL